MAMEINKNYRDSNIELYRIIVMLFIVAHHCVLGADGLWSIMKNNPYSINSSFYYILGMWGKTGINCFVMITGYFMCTSQISKVKVLKLYLQIVFYSLIGNFIISTVNGNFSVVNFVWCFIPIKGISSNFMGCFILFYLLIPFLNIVYANIDKRKHLFLIIILVFMYVIMPLQTKYNVIMNYVSWFITLYFISSYIRRYSIWNESDFKMWGIISIMSIFVSIVSVFAVVRLTYGQHAYFFVGEVNRPMALMVGFCTFVFFKNVRIRYNKLINLIASTTFGVFLLHTRIHTVLWSKWIPISEYYAHPFMIVLSIILVFVVCSAIDVFRIMFIEKPTFDYFKKRGIL